MSKGKAKHQARLNAIQAFGKDLARRARSKCELCEENDDLRIVDIDSENEPSFDTLMLTCARCRAVLDGRRDDPKTLRFLETAIWSDIVPVAVSARTQIKQVDADWARDALELVRTSRPSQPPG